MTKTELHKIVGSLGPIALGVADDTRFWHAQCRFEGDRFLTGDQGDAPVPLPVGRQCTSVDVIDIQVPASPFRIAGNPFAEP